AGRRDGPGAAGGNPAYGHLRLPSRHHSLCGDISRHTSSHSRRLRRSCTAVAPSAPGPADDVPHLLVTEAFEVARWRRALFLVEPVPHQLVSLPTDTGQARLGDALQAGAEVGGCANGGVIHLVVGAHIPEKDLTGADPDPGGQERQVQDGPWLVECLD